MYQQSETVHCIPLHPSRLPRLVGPEIDVLRSEICLRNENRKTYHHGHESKEKPFLQTIRHDVLLLWTQGTELLWNAAMTTCHYWPFEEKRNVKRENVEPVALPNTMESRLRGINLVKAAALLL